MKWGRTNIYMAWRLAYSWLLGRDFCLVLRRIAIFTFPDPSPLGCFPGVGCMHGHWCFIVFTFGKGAVSHRRAKRVRYERFSSLFPFG